MILLLRIESPLAHPCNSKVSCLHGLCRIAKLSNSRELACTRRIHRRHLLSVEDGLIVQGWQFQILLQLKLLGTGLMTDRAERTTPHLIVPILSMHLEQLAVLLKVTDLLLDVDRGRLLVNMEGHLDVFVLQLLLE